LKLDREKDNYKLSSIENFGRTLNWLAYCKSFSKNKNQKLVTQFYEADKKRADNYFSFDFGMLLFNHRQTIFFMRKKSTFSKLNYIRKQFLGIKAKKLISRNWQR
jgi:hypothetical protein